MPNNHPYDKKSDRRQQDLNDLVDGAVNFGLGISSTVLSGIAGALDSVEDSLNRAAQRPEQNSFIAYRRKLDNSLAGHYGGWMTMGVLGWVFGGCFAIAALVMAVLAGVAPNDASLWSAMPVFNILAPTFTACTLGFFVMGYAGCHAANYFGRLRRYLRGMHGFTAELPELTDEAKHSVTVLRKAKEYLEEKPELAEELSAAERRKRAQLQSKPVYRYVALAIFLFGLVAAAYGLYAITNHVGNYGIYFALFGFAAIFLFSSYNMLPTARNNHSAIMKRADRAEQAAADYVKRYPNGAFPVPSYYAHPTVLKQMMDAIEEGRAVTVPEALEAVKARLKALNADVQVEQEEYDEVVLIKAMFLNHQYA